MELMYICLIIFIFGTLIRIEKLNKLKFEQAEREKVKSLVIQINKIRSRVTIKLAYC